MKISDKKKENSMNYKEERPWGSFENILDEDYCKVKTITIQPGQAPSYQYHFKRSEVYVIVQGKASIKLDDVEKEYTVGDVIKVPVLTKHQVKNIGEDNLIFVEVQLGEYFGEDDIVRIDDKYGRA
jgi:mannose-6-phosphate isomerase-like protein (cupin superfamily)